MYFSKRTLPNPNDAISFVDIEIFSLPKTHRFAGRDSLTFAEMKEESMLFSDIGSRDIVRTEIKVGLLVNSRDYFGGRNEDQEKEP